MTDLYIVGVTGVYPARVSLKYIVEMSGNGSTICALGYTVGAGNGTSLYTVTPTATLALTLKQIERSFPNNPSTTDLSSLSISHDGNTILLSKIGFGSSPSSFNIYTYTPGPNTWTTYNLISTSLGFGIIAWDNSKINEAGTKIYARMDGGLRIFNWNGVAVTNPNILFGTGMSHREVMMSRNCQYTIGSDTTSTIRVYVDTGSDTWVQRGANLILPTPPIGVTFTRYAISGDITNDGTHLLITVSNGKGNSFQGFAYYVWDGTNYIFQNVTNVIPFVTDGKIINLESINGPPKIRISGNGTRMVIGDDYNPSGDPVESGLSSSFVYFEYDGSQWNPKDSFAAYGFTANHYNIAVDSDFSRFVVPGVYGPKDGFGYFVRQAPVAVNDSFGSFNSNIARIVNVKANDDMKNNTGETLQIVSNGGLSLTADSPTGNVTIASGTAIGNYTFTYRWITASGYIGNTASATLQIVSGAPTISDDTFGPYIFGQTNTFNPVTNDNLNDGTLTNFTITDYHGLSPSHLSVNSTTGEVTVLSTIPLGSYTLTYSITTNGGTTNGGTVTFDVESQYTPIVLAPIDVTVDSSIGTGIDVITPSDLGGRDPSDVDVIIVSDSGTNATVVGNLILIDPGTPPGNYFIQYDLIDNATDSQPTGNPEVITISVVLYAVNGTLDSNELTISSFQESQTFQKIFVRDPPLTVTEVKDILLANYTGSNTQTIVRNLDLVLPDFIKQGNNYFLEKHGQKVAKTLLTGISYDIKH